MALKLGLYDQLVTESLKRALGELSGRKLGVLLEELEESEGPDYLARHLVRDIREKLRALKGEDRVANQIAFVNRTSLADPVTEPGQVLKAIFSTPIAPPRPSTPLAQSSLIMNALDEPRLGFELEREMQSADSVWMLVSFIQWRGWQRLRVALEEMARSGKSVRVLTTTYMGASDYRALEAIARLPNVEMKISMDGSRRRLHAKAWLFARESGFSSAYVGSANLSGPALEDGIEWTVKLSETEAPHVIEKFRGAFASHWNDSEFKKFSPYDSASCEELRKALERGRVGAGKPEGGSALFFDLRPHPYQQATLDQLEVARLDLGQWRNLVVAPTGTGKTLVAAFDYARQIQKDGLKPRLLFVAHREELLIQARTTFRHVLRDESFGQLLVGGAHPTSYEYLFATIQSLQSQDLVGRLGSEYWQFVVIDEAHHTPAQSYREVLQLLTPRILLGLTATPERMDGESILPWFGGQIADEMRLWHAIERQYLVPFDYYGMHDGTDLSNLTWSRGGYAIAELNQMLSGSEKRANLVLHEFVERYGDWKEARALGFCVSVRHAEFMAEVFRKAGIPAIAITSESGTDLRTNGPQRLRRREVNVVFTVDLYNEGVDLPEVDCLLFLRPTESATVFIQQLGRGLRLDSGKRNCLVLDFIGNQRREFRFDIRYRALFGGTRQDVIRQLESGVTRLPGSCYFRLDQESRAAILRNLKASLETRRSRMVEEVRVLGETNGRSPRLEEFLRETKYELRDVYKDSIAGWTGLLRDAGWLELEASENDLILSRQLKQILHIDSPARLRFYEGLMHGEPFEIGEAERRMTLMLTYRLLQGRAGEMARSWESGLISLLESKAVRREFLEVIGVLRQGIRMHSEEQFYRKDWPLFVHRRYRRDEVLTAVGFKTWGSKALSFEGVVRLKEHNTELLFVTLDKSEKHFSPSTRYEDYAVSETKFHWQSQGSTSVDSNAGRRYLEQAENGEKFLLFVRPTNAEAFVFLGDAKYESHYGSKPISIVWGLEAPMPAWLFEICASLRAA